MGMIIRQNCSDFSFSPQKLKNFKEIEGISPFKSCLREKNGIKKLKIFTICCKINDLLFFVLNKIMDFEN